MSFEIENGVFKRYTGPEVKVLELPEGITEVESFSLRNSVLKGCEKIVFPVSLKRIGDYALNYDYGSLGSLEELEFLGDVEQIGKEAFSYVGYYGKNGLKKLTFHGKVGQICDFAFNRAKITVLEFPNGVDTIGKNAFYNCALLEQVHAPGLKKIGNEAFGGCKNLQVVDVPDTASVGEEAFHDSKLLRKNGVAVLNGVLLSMDPGADIPPEVETVDRYALPWGHKQSDTAE